MIADLMCGDKELATARAEDSEPNQGSVTAVIECEAGELVWVRSVGNGYRVAGYSADKYNIFSGFLLQAY